MCIWNLVMRNLNLNIITVSVSATVGAAQGRSIFFFFHALLRWGRGHSFWDPHVLWTCKSNWTFRTETKGNVTYVTHEWWMVPGCRSSAAWQGRAQTQRSLDAHSRHCTNAAWNTGRGCWQNPTIPETTLRTRDLVDWKPHGHTTQRLVLQREINASVRFVFA